MSAAAATTTAPGFDYFSGGSLVPDSVADYPPNFLDSVDRLLQDLDPSTVMIQTLFPSHAMPTPRRVADPTGVYGPQDADSAEAVRHKTSENNRIMSIPEEAFPQFTAVAAARPKNRTEGKIHSILMESLPSRPSKKVAVLH